MSKLIEYLNPNSHQIQLATPDKKTITIKPKGKIILSDWFMSYCPKHLRVVRIIGEQQNIVPKKIESRTTTPYNKNSPKPNQRHKLVLNGSNSKKKRRSEVRTQIPAKFRKKKNKINRKQIVGKKSKIPSSILYNQACQENRWIVSNNVGIGILSFNRLASLQRLISSIRSHTDLSKTVVFVSDESTNPEVSKWLADQKDIVTLSNQDRLGIAGNSNRLLRCLSRFKYKILLNDDVEIVKEGWENFYTKAHLSTGYHHFCYHQEGVYGAKKNDGLVKKVGQFQVKTISSRPHGAVMFLTQQLFDQVGYFDERFGLYGIEHVDWSTRAIQTKLVPSGYHDIVGSEHYFKIHSEKTSLENIEKSTSLRGSRELYNKVKSADRIYVSPTIKSTVPSMSIVVPIRNIGRQESIQVVINNLRGQLFPNLEIIISEQDEKQKFNSTTVSPCKHLFAANRRPGQLFNKSYACNFGVAQTSYNKVIIHDGDMLLPSHYSEKVYSCLGDNDSVHLGSQVLYLDRNSTEHIVGSGKVDPNYKCERAVEYFEGGSLACTKETYFKIGGFNELFEGYGMEDCDFFSRLKQFSKLYNVRSIDLIHLWHDRTPGWVQHHKKNKIIHAQVRKKYEPTEYVKFLNTQLKNNYPEAYKKVEK